MKANNPQKRDFAQTADINVLRSQLSSHRLQRIEQTAKNRQRGLRLFMDAVWDPHNLAAIARTADAFGIQQIDYTTANALPEETLITSKSGASANRWITFHHAPQTHSHLQHYRDQNWHIVATALSERTQSLYEVNWVQYPRLLIVVGNEHSGISPDAQHLAHTHIKIPMRGMVSSLNVSVAAAITLAEITRQRDQSPQDFTLPPSEYQTLTEMLIRAALHP